MKRYAGRGVKGDSEEENRGLIEPYGGELVNLVVDQVTRDEIVRQIPGMKEVQLSLRTICDLELLTCGAFSPLRGFMGFADYASVVEGMRLADGTLWPIPITLRVEDPSGYEVRDLVALRDVKQGTLAVMEVAEIFEADLAKEAECVFGGNPEHPGVEELFRRGRWCLAGPLTVLGGPKHSDFRDLRLTPEGLRRVMEERNWSDVVAFNTRNPMHRAHEELTRRAARKANAGLLIHPVVGATKPGDVDYYTRVRCYQALVENNYRPDEVVLAILPLAMRMGGPREAVWHAIIRRNFGANLFIVGRDHAGPGKDSKGNAFYPPYGAQELVAKHQAEIGVTMLSFENVVYVPGEGGYREISEVPKGAEVLSLSGTQVRDDYLKQGKPLPGWFTRPEVGEILRHAYPPKHRQGVTVWMTGLAGAGKTTISERLSVRLLEYGRTTTVLDGAVVRTHLSRGLGFSRADRDTNIRRMGFVSAEITRHGGTVICAAIAPYRKLREEIRELVGNFVEVFVDAPLEVCEKRDVKGLYEKARAGRIHGLTGVDDPYERPGAPDVVCCTDRETVDESVEKIVRKLQALGYVRKGA